MNRRKFLGRCSAAAVTLAAPGFAAERPSKRVAAIVTHYTHNSHADVLVSRLLQGCNLDFQPPYPRLELAGLYTDQLPKSDLSRDLARKHGFRIFPTIAETLTLGGRDLAVDGVLLIGEHGNYPLSANGQIQYPRRRFFEETAAVFRQSRRAIPVFSDKHLSWNWEDAKWMYDTARELRAPFMAGSSIPGTWRRPEIEMKRGSPTREALELSFGPLEAYGYHGLEAMQSIVERRRGGETGVRAVQLVSGPEVWQAMEAGRFDANLFQAAAQARQAKGRFKGELREALQPVAIFLEYVDGFKAVLLHDMGAANNEWVTAWSEEGGQGYRATAHYTQEARPFGHFTLLLQGIEQMILTGKPTWPVERTLLVTGVLAAAFESKEKAGARIETPHLGIAYSPTFTWTPPPPPPPDRPMQGQ